MPHKSEIYTGIQEISKGSSSAGSIRVAENVLADVIILTANHPYEYSNTAIQNELALSTVTVSKSTAALSNFEWLTIKKFSGTRPSDGRRYTERKYAPTTSFWQARNTVLERLLASMNTADTQLYEEALAAQVQVEATNPETRENDLAQVNHIGRVILLGSRHNPAGFGYNVPWFEGTVGIDALVKTEAAAQKIATPTDCEAQ